MSTQPELHSSIVAMVSLASGIASRHPDMGLCQLDKLKAAGIPEHQILAVIDIARHIRDEASLKLDSAFDQKTELNFIEKVPEDSCCEPPIKNGISIVVESTESCCSSTSSGQSCC